VQRAISQKVAVSVVFVAAMFMSIMDVTIVNVALPTIGRDFQVSPLSVDSISIGFLVSLAVFIPASGWLGNRFGAKNTLLTAIVIFTVASALCGMATSLGELVAFRVLQGVGGGMLAPVGMAMLLRTFPPEERIRAGAILTVPTALAPALGPVLGGLFTDKLSWRWVFFVNVPIGIAALAFGLLFLVEPPRAQASRFDVVGFVLSGVGLGALMYGLSEGPDRGWGSAQVLGTIAVGVVLLILMVAVELRIENPIVAVRLLGDQLFRVANGVMILASTAFLGGLYLVAIYYQDGRGMSALASGLSTFPEAIGVMVGSQIATRVLYPRIGPKRHICIGLAGVAASLGLMATLTADSSLWLPRLLMFALGLSMSQVFVPMQAAAFATTLPREMGHASTMFNALRQLGGAVGVAIFTSVVVAVGTRKPASAGSVVNLDAYRIAFAVAAVIAVCAIAIALRIRDRDAIETLPETSRARRRLQPAPDRDLDTAAAL